MPRKSNSQNSSSSSKNSQSSHIPNTQYYYPFMQQGPSDSNVPPQQFSSNFSSSSNNTPQYFMSQPNNFPPNISQNQFFQPFPYQQNPMVSSIQNMGGSFHGNVHPSPFQFPCSQLPNSSQPGLEHISLNDDDDNDDDGGDDDDGGGNDDDDDDIVEEVPVLPVQKKRTRDAWSYAEEVTLAKSWTTMSQDSETGNAQKSKDFWDKVTAYYDEHKPKNSPIRKAINVKGHYYAVIPEVNTFSGWYNNFLTNRASGNSDDDVLEATLAKWRSANKDKNFKYLHVWRVVQAAEKWAPQQMAGNPFNSQPEGDVEARKRPMGQQKAKRLGKNKATASEDNPERWAEVKEIQREKIRQSALDPELRQKTYDQYDALLEMQEFQLLS